MNDNTGFFAYRLEDYRGQHAGVLRTFKAAQVARKQLPFPSQRRSMVAAKTAGKRC